jgi:uncharacterized membrane protein YtjA (UPF0391 family)
LHDPSRATALPFASARALQPSFSAGGDMVRWAMGLLAVAIVSAFVGFTGVAREAALAGKWIFCLGLVLSGIALLHGPRTVV